MSGEDRSAIAVLNIVPIQGLDRLQKMTSPRLRGLACDRSGGEAEAVRDRSSDALPDPLSAWQRAGMKAIGLAPTCGRSDRAAGAERGRSFRRYPGPLAPCGLCGSAAARPSASSPLTPARSQSKIMAGHSGCPNGAGIAVPSGTSAEPWRNLQLTDIAGLFERFHGFHFAPRVHVRVCTYARTHTCEGSPNSGTVER